MKFYDAEIFPIAGLGLVSGLFFVACATATWSIPLPMSIFYVVLVICLLAFIPIRSRRNLLIMLAGFSAAQLAWLVPFLFWS